MKPFMDEAFLLHSKTAQLLYERYAKDQPVIDYHCHLSPRDIAEDRQFENLTQVWLAGDHYKWRAMRTNGVSEDHMTGDAPDKEKFLRWAETVPATLRNPLYHWTHLELKRYFGIEKLLSPETAEEIYETASAMLRKPGFSVRGLLNKMKVKLVCTTDDPVDSLEYHKQIAESDCEIKVLPTFRPDKATAIADPEAFKAYIETLSRVSGVSIRDFDSLIAAVDQRHDFFHSLGCRISDSGIEGLYDVSFDRKSLDGILQRTLKGQAPSPLEEQQLQTGFLVELGKMNFRKGWVMQIHYGAIRNNNQAIMQSYGPDAGCDSIHDKPAAAGLSRLLGLLSADETLPKTVLYNLNPADNAMVATMAGNFQDGTVPGKIQFGAAWWFLDQKQGMIDHMDTLSSLGLLSRFVGMLTDSRSFLSYPRHEYFRRLLCNLLGEDIEKGEIPWDEELVGTMVSNICYGNIKSYLGVEL